MGERPRMRVGRWGRPFGLMIALLCVILTILRTANAQAACTVSWAVNADGFWDVASNWSTNAVPSASDDVCINVAGNITVTHRQGTTSINSLRSEEALILSGGTFSVTTDIQVNNNFTLSGGTLPNACVDYLVDYWVTAYWLHVDVLGNPRGSFHTAAIVENHDARRTSPAGWTDPGGLPFAIVQDLRTVPADIRSGFRILYESTPAAVVQRSEASTCRDDTPPIDRVSVAPRERTLDTLLRRMTKSQ